MSYWGEIIGAVTSLYENQQNQHGADAAAHNSQAGLDFLKSVYGDAKGYQAPYMGLGTTGVNGLTALANHDYSGFENSPDYLYAREQMQYGNDHSAASRGMLYDPGTQIELGRQFNGLASQNLGHYRGSLMDMAQMGQNSATALGNLGAGVGSNLLQGYGQLSAAQQQGYDSNGQLIGRLGGLFNNYWNGRNQQTNSSYSNSGGDYSDSGGWDNYGGLGFGWQGGGNP